ncbi:acyl-CoA thioesterase [Halobacteriovorax sp. GB3]|uniref:acyl-CoA thioesterase n=1 Tax=Halobacteriovorax sp. GB3 TaxID=2719615 RepID=UPI002361BC2E|nr:acyl-CoA thioesterase [Halobacteriovorax sp. GB3]MDD0854178.1 acyl-CoA thioesterase [Halobacteriovorax sp. GB3]
MSFEKQIEQSRTVITKAVFPNTTNHYDTLYGGQALDWMDEVAFITATRFSRQRMVTVSSDQVSFKKPIPSGTIIELVGKVTHVGTSSLKVSVEMHMENMYDTDRTLAVKGAFSFVAIDENKKPEKLKINP